MTAGDAVGFGTILGMWAHPDDETWASGGLMAQAVTAGQRVVCVTATKGEAGFPDDDPRSRAERSAIREAELAACLAVVGVTEHRWLGHADGGCADIPDEEAVAVVAAILDEVCPDTVLTFGPDGGTGHPDHVSLCRWTTMAVELRERAGQPAPRLLYSAKSREWTETVAAGMDFSDIMMIPDLVPEITEQTDLAVWLSCDEDLLAMKVTALRAQVSQIEPQVQAMGLDRFRAFTRDEFFRERLPTDAATLASATAFSRR